MVKKNEWRHMTKKRGTKRSIIAVHAIDVLQPRHNTHIHNTLNFI